MKFYNRNNELATLESRSAKNYLVCKSTWGIVLEGYVTDANNCTQYRSVTTNMLEFFALACDGDTLAEGFGRGR